MRAIKKNPLWGTVSTREEALRVIRQVSFAFWVLAGLQAVIGLFVDRALLLDACIYAVLAFLLYRFSSRAAAVALLLLALAAVAFTILNITTNGSGGSNILLAAIVTWAAVRGVQATFFLGAARR